MGVSTLVIEGLLCPLVSMQGNIVGDGRGYTE